MSSFPVTFQSGTIEANGIKIRYHRTGGDKPSLVLAHGMTDMGLCWTRVAQRLCHKYDVVVYDARGHGDSDAPARGHEPEVRAEDLRGLIESLKLDQPRLLGHSLGAITVGVLASKCPDLARCVILEDPPFPEQLHVEPTNEQRQTWRRNWEQWRNYALPQRGQSQADLEAICRQQSPYWDDIEIGPWAEAKLKVSPYIFDIPNLNEFKWWQRLPKITCPALLLTADHRRGALMTEAAEGFLRNFCPAIELVRLSDSGHNIHRDQFERFMQLVADFLARN